MRFLRKNSSSAEADDAAETLEVDADGVPVKGHTPKKGRPTPSRRDAEGKRRGPTPPPPKTTREAIKRSRELRKANPVSKQERRARMREQRERMMAGDERYMLPRDRGPVRAFIRDCVDARHNLLGLFMPLALVVLATMFIQNPLVTQYLTLFAMLMLLVMVGEAIYNGKRITRLVGEHFPNSELKGRSIGWYAFVRASQLRRLRVPKPRVRAGDPIKIK